jgi:hypothetical protein
MILRDDEEVESARNEFKYKSMSELKDASDVEYNVDREFLVIRRSLNVQVSEEDVEK